MKKTKFIQIWRAFAVLAVLGYHFWPELIPRGYLGVDLFFIVSGFVVTASLMRVRESNLSIYLDFFAARINRLIPTLIVVSAVFFVLTIVYSSPISSQTETFGTIIANFFAVSNLYFYRKPSGYFDSPLEFSTFLHTWSLSLEWQFYLILIVLHFFCFIAFKNRFKIYTIKVLFLLFGLISFIFCGLQFFYSYSIPGLANPIKEQLFYLPFSRIFLFLAGAFLAICRPEINKIKFRTIKHVGFLQSLCFSAFFFLIISKNHSSKFDFYGSIVVLFLTCCSISLGEPAIYRSFRILLPIGNASYSIYLWHWPILVFTKLFFGDSIFALIVSFIVTLLLSSITYQLIEQNLKFSNKNSRFRRNSIHVVIVYTSLVVLSAIFIYIANNSYWNNHQTSLRKSSNETSQLSKACWTYPNYDSNKFLECRYPVSNQIGWVLLIGDSHAYAIADGIQEFYRQRGMGLIFYPLCDISDNSEICRQYLNFSLGIAESPEVKSIVFTGRISRQLKLYDQHTVINNRKNWILDIQALNKDWTYVLDVPNVGADPCGGFEWWKQTHTCKKKISLMSLSELEARLLEKSFTNSLPVENIFDPWNFLCDKFYCKASSGSIKLYSDDNHLNIHGSFYLSRRLASKIQEFNK